MTLVMTLLARDEIDVVDAWLAFHLNAGVDLVIATDNRSQDGTTDVLEAYARSGHVQLIREPGEDLRQDEWVTRMARLAATEHGADWVINSDADEFWWPRGASLSEVLAAVPPRYGTVGAFLRVFCPRPGDDDFADRMTVRFSALAPINDPASLYKPIRKVIHRGHPEIRLTRGNHALVGSPFAPLRGWFPVECFHFPLRTAAQCAHKAELQGRAFAQHIARAPTAYHADMYKALRSGRIGEYYEALVVGDDELERGLESGRLVVDTRLRDALRALSDPSGPGYVRPGAGPALGFPVPTLVEDAEYAVEAAVLGEADVVRLQRRLDELEGRLQTVEQRLPRRVYRKLTRTAGRVLGERGGASDR
jgi:tetrahydromethanopterin S-methyltransferase subunit G